MFNFLFKSENESKQTLIGKCTNGHLYKMNNGFCKYCEPSIKTKEVCEEPILEIKPTTDVKTITEVKPKSKKDALLDSLAYLKNKSNKTKQDKDTMYTIEMILKNMK